MTILADITRLSCRVPSLILVPVTMAGLLGLFESVSGASHGRIEGTVRLADATGAPIRTGAYPTRRVTSAPAHSGASNVIVFIKDAPSASHLPILRRQIVQRNEAFEPRVTAITRGSVVEFPNADPFFHNVFSLSRSAVFDLGRYPRGESRVRTFDRAGLVKVFCHLHSHMTATIMVFDHPYFAVPAENGRFAIEDVPPGRYQITAWHERIGESSHALSVEANRTANVEFVLPVESE